MKCLKSKRQFYSVFGCCNIVIKTITLFELHMKIFIIIACSYERISYRFPDEYLDAVLQRLTQRNGLIARCKADSISWRHSLIRTR